MEVSCLAKPISPVMNGTHLTRGAINTGARLTLIQGGRSAAYQQASAAVVIAQEQLRQAELQANQQLNQALEKAP